MTLTVREVAVGDAQPFRQRVGVDRDGELAYGTGDLHDALRIRHTFADDSTGSVGDTDGDALDGLLLPTRRCVFCTRTWRVSARHAPALRTARTTRTLVSRMRTNLLSTDEAKVPPS